jgi:hypothetical protein
MFARPNAQNRVHDVGKMKMNITNHGYLGNDGPGQSTALKNPCPPNQWADQCEFPAGSGQEYLFQAGLWVGALIVEQGFETKRVSTGTDGWFSPSINEFWPGPGAANGIIERSTRPGRTNCLGEYVTDEANAVSDQDFICSYADTLKDPGFVDNDPVDGVHRPLGIKISQKSYAFSQAFAEDFILVDFEIENIASNFLKNLYVGLYVDADVGRKDMLNQHTDDICGFLENYQEVNGADTVTIPINVAWIADNDGRDPTMTSGPLIVPNVTGTRVIRGPNPRLKTSFNWWISNGDVTLDYGPSWEDYCRRDSMGMGWTRLFGTPMGDEHKYQILSNGEFDFWQIMVDKMSQVAPQNIGTVSNPINKGWCTDDPSPNAADIANGYDTRYLLSWGPLGVYDYTDESGRRIYRLNPGEKFNMTIAYVGGENFHDPSHPQPSNQNIDSSLFNFSDLRQNARWALEVYDNRMHDTPMWDLDGDGKPDVGDGWYGEDVGTDGIYTEMPAGFRPRNCNDPSQPYDSIPVWYFTEGDPALHAGANAKFAGYYTGPDCDGSERNGRIDSVSNANNSWSSEDQIIPDNLIYHGVPKLGDWDMGWMAGNGFLDQGDGVPDFTGPPPPPIPALLYALPGTHNSASHAGGVVRTDQDYIGGLGYELRGDEVILRWAKKSSENVDYRDPFSRVQDFEGYKILWANVNQDDQYNLLDEFDLVDFAYFSIDTDSMMTIPVNKAMYDSLMAAGRGDSTILGKRGTLHAVSNNTGFESIRMAGNDSTYEYHIKANRLWPRYYSVVAKDFGDPHSGLGPLETRPTANAVLLAPAGSAHDPVRVVPNPYRAYQDYTQTYGGPGGGSWENMNDGTTGFYPQADRRLEFMNLPDQCLIRIFTVAGDLVQIIPHNTTGDKSAWPSLNSERWDLNSRNRQQVVSGIYLFSVEDLTPGNGHKIETGKFVIIR